jgi:hypothetical protein
MPNTLELPPGVARTLWYRVTIVRISPGDRWTKSRSAISRTQRRLSREPSVS